MVFQRGAHFRRRELRHAVARDQLPAKAVDPGYAVIGGAVLFDESIVSAGRVRLHVGVKRFGGLRHVAFAHQGFVIEKQQCLKVERELVERAFVGGGFERHRQVVCQRRFIHKIRNRRENAELGVHTDLVVRKKIQIRRGGRIVADKLERFRQSVLADELHGHVRQRFGKRRLQHFYDRVLLVVPDDDVVCIHRFFRASGKRQHPRNQHNGG
ncbi:hypothetical protein SDC9_153674 [bioreactor metagenome]|uniref:Uncharacterized protein n=1 Tax=bioreactor metagenome TaxID=1076179 RepID=A0A645EWJ9_9ZZZZ